MENWTGLFKWFVELSGEAKVVIALLLGLSIYFGYMHYSIQREYDSLNKTIVADSKECSDKIAKANTQWKAEFDKYRDRVEAENKSDKERVQKKLDELMAKNEQLMLKGAFIDAKYRELTNKIKP